MNIHRTFLAWEAHDRTVMMHIVIYAFIILLTGLFRETDSHQNVDSYFSICLALKDDDDVLEWIEYHHRMGCSKFYVFDNNSKPPMNATLADHINTGLVEYVYLQGSFKKAGVPHVQFYIYDQCIKRYNKLHIFMGFIDVDEFIVPKAINTSIPDVLKNYEQYGGLALNWMRFGSSGFDRRPQGYFVLLKDTFIHFRTIPSIHPTIFY